MNMALGDSLDLAWKMHLVESGFAQRKLLETYESERMHVTRELLESDNRYAKMFSQRDSARSCSPHDEFVKSFKEASEFLTGYAKVYKPNIINWSPQHPARSELFSPAGINLRTGRLLANADVSRVVDFKPVHLELEVPLPTGLVDNDEVVDGARLGGGQSVHLAQTQMLG